MSSLNMTFFMMHYRMFFLSQNFVSIDVCPINELQILEADSLRYSEIKYT